jgi:AcrR family transcriptional regulator
VEALPKDEPRELTGERAQRIVEAARASVASRGIAASTFDAISREAGASRGLLHYYFGTKERLLIEVVRRDTELRVAHIEPPLAAAGSVDDVLDVLVSNLTDLIEHDPGFFVLIFELFTAGHRKPELQKEIGELFQRTRHHVAEILEAKAAEGVLSPRFPAEAVVSLLLSIADGLALQVLADPERDHSAAIAAGREAARFLLTSD